MMEKITDFQTCLNAYVLAVIRLSGYRKPPGETIYTLASRVLGISPIDCVVLPEVGFYNAHAGRVACKMFGHVLRRRGHLRNLKPLVEMLTEEFDFNEWLDFMVQEGRARELIELWDDLNRPITY